MMKKKLAAVIMAVTVLAGCTANPAFANTDSEAEQAAYTEYQESTESTETGEQAYTGTIHSLDGENIREFDFMVRFS